MWQEAIEVRKDITAAVLRKKARSEKDGLVASRLLGIANILDGMDRDAAARAAGMTRQTLRDWVHRYNGEGIEGLRNRPKGHPPRALTLEQEREIDALVSQPPKDKTLVRWRCVDVRAEIERKFGVVLHENSVGNLLRRLGFRRLSVRPLHPEGDFEAQEAFKKTSLPAWRKSCPPVPPEKPLSSGSKTKPASGKKAP
jgi:transposase